MSSAIKPQGFYLEASDKLEHPNKLPFKCALFAVDKPSDGPPGGAGGKRIRISSTVCEKHIHTFVGMALNIDYENGMQDHNSRFKVAVIEKAYLSMDGFAMVEGYIYAKDFPDVVGTIRYYNALAAETGYTEYQFGASLEMEASVVPAADDPEGLLDVVDYCGTGAAILFAESAAYKTTRFAAKHKPKEEQKVNEEELKAMKEMLKNVAAGISTLTASVQSVASEVGTIKTEVDQIKAANAEEKTKTGLQLAQERAEAAERELADLKAAAKDKPEDGARKTLSASQLLSKYGGKYDQDEMDASTFCAAVDKLGLPTHESLKLKLQARRDLSEKETN
ncbi:3-oxoacyl-ACP reductase [Paenibacillus chitinolyticus]|nr:hypothetical protein [Paenibacillus chitinolyticus]QAV20121.1 3-oxoacyl-ACP reductase [Paenibacillus chitinolyticus]